MKRHTGQIIFVTIIISFFSTVAIADSNKKDKCLKTRAKIENIQTKMKHKYSNKQGVKYRKTLDKLYKDEFKYCF